jgi:hypothetical protein
MRQPRTLAATVESSPHTIRVQLSFLAAFMAAFWRKGREFTVNSQRFQTDILAKTRWRRPSSGRLEQRSWTARKALKCTSVPGKRAAPPRMGRERRHFDGIGGCVYKTTCGPSGRPVRCRPAERAGASPPVPRPRRGRSPRRPGPAGSAGGLAGLAGPGSQDVCATGPESARSAGRGAPTSCFAQVAEGLERAAGGLAALPRSRTAC